LVIFFRYIVRWVYGGIQQFWRFLAHDSIYAVARCMLSPVRLSVLLSSHRWISQKRLKLGSCSFHHRVALWL